jgi:phosphotransferase system HPr-like phosphotransfer protein
MNKEITIRINTIEKIKRLSNITVQFDSEIEVLSGRYIVDGKSIMALFSVDILEPMIARIISDNEEEIKSFNRVMEEFKYEDNL